MKITVNGGDGYTLTFEAPTDQDLSRQDVETRIYAVMRRELQRFQEIVTVGLKDAEAYVAEQQRLRALPPGSRGPTQIVGAGNRDPQSRVVLDDGDKETR